jgi:hypothetical protein
LYILYSTANERLILVAFNFIAGRSLLLLS